MDPGSSGVPAQTVTDNWKHLYGCKDRYSEMYGMEMCGLESNEYLELPEVYSMVPVRAGQEDVKMWPYLHEVKIPQITAEIGLLNGNTWPRALEP